VSDNFKSIVVCDFEYEVEPGDLPNVLCMVAYVLDENLRHVRTIRLWRGQFGPTPPFDIGPDSLFVAYSAWAEMTCFKMLGWPFPVHIYDQHTAYLAASGSIWRRPLDFRSFRRTRSPLCGSPAAVTFFTAAPVREIFRALARSLVPSVRGLVPSACKPRR
jgi:hypothetical protein